MRAIDLISRLASASVCLGLFGCPSKTDAPQAKDETTPQSNSQAQAASQPSPHGAIVSGNAGAPFSGLVVLGEGLAASDVKPTDVLFVMARESQGGGRAGRLVAVKRFGNVEFPLRYELSQGDLMVPGLPFTGPFIVTARLDRDGDPMTRGEDDLYATFADEVKSGQEGVGLTLKKGAPPSIPAPEGVNAPPSAEDNAAH